MNDDKGFTPETVEEQIDQHAFSPSPLPFSANARVIREVQAYYEEDRRSAARMWARLVQRVQAANETLAGEENLWQSKKHSLFEASYSDKEKQDTGDILVQNETPSTLEDFTLRSQGAKPLARGSKTSFRRILSMSGAAAAVLVIALGWVLLSSGIHAGRQAPSTRVGSSNVQTTPRSGPLCSFTAPGPQHLNYDTIHSLSWASNGAITTTSGGLVTYNVNTCKQLASRTTMQAQGAFWSPDRTRLLLLSYSDQVSILDAHGNVLVTHSAQPASIATSVTTGFMPLFSLSGGANNNVLMTAAWSPNGTRVASVFQLDAVHGNRSGVEIWDAKTGAHQMTLSCPGDQGITNALSPVTAWSSDGKYLLGNESDGNRTCVWNAQTGQLIVSIPIRTGIVGSFSPDGKSVVLVNGNNTVATYDLATRRITRTFSAKDASPFSPSVAWSPDGAFLAIAGQDLHILTVSNGAEIATLALTKDASVDALAWSPDGTMIATVSSRSETNLPNADGTIVTTPGSPDGFVSVWRVH